MDPILSVIIVNFNYGRFLEAAIRSVIEQRLSAVELIVVDGGSADDSVEIIRKYADRIAWWVSEKDNGQSDAFNKGFLHAHGKYLTWLNSDDVLVPASLSKVVAELQKHPECEWFTANSFRCFSSGNVLEANWGPHFYPGFLQRKRSPVVAFGPSTFIAKSLLDRMGGVDERFHLAMDTELWIRFISSGIKQRRINAFVWGFRMHGDSKTAEFDDHRVSEETRLRFKHENDMIYEKTGYRVSKLLHRMVQIWRVLDGSFLRRQYLRMTFRHFDFNWAMNTGGKKLV